MNSKNRVFFNFTVITFFKNREKFSNLNRFCNDATSLIFCNDFINIYYNFIIFYIINVNVFFLFINVTNLILTRF